MVVGLPILVAAAAWIWHSPLPLLLMQPLAAALALCLVRHRGFAATISTAMTAVGAVLAGDLTAAWCYTLAVGLTIYVAENARARVDHFRQVARKERFRADQSAVVDVPTRCVNAAGLELVAPPMLSSARRRGDAVYCAAVQVPGIAEVRAEFGERMAGELAQGIAEALRTSTRAADVVARTQDGLFHVVGPGRGVSATELERRCRMHLMDRRPVPSHVWSVPLRIGAATLAPWEEGDLRALLELADADLAQRYNPMGARPRGDLPEPSPYRG